MIGSIIIFFLILFLSHFFVAVVLFLCLCTLKSPELQSYQMDLCLKWNRNFSKSLISLIHFEGNVRVRMVPENMVVFFLSMPSTLAARAGQLCQVKEKYKTRLSWVLVSAVKLINSLHDLRCAAVLMQILRLSSRRVALFSVLYNDASSFFFFIPSCDLPRFCIKTQ